LYIIVETISLDPVIGRTPGIGAKGGWGTIP